MPDQRCLKHEGSSADVNARTNADGEAKLCADCMAVARVGLSTLAYARHLCPQLIHRCLCLRKRCIIHFPISRHPPQRPGQLLGKVHLIFALPFLIASAGSGARGPHFRREVEGLRHAEGVAGSGGGRKGGHLRAWRWERDGVVVVEGLDVADEGGGWRRRGGRSGDRESGGKAGGEGVEVTRKDGGRGCRDGRRSGRC